MINAVHGSIWTVSYYSYGYLTLTNANVGYSIKINQIEFVNNYFIKVRGSIRALYGVFL